MNLISMLSSVQSPGGLWTTLINWIQGGIGNFGWTILLLVIIVKLVLSPLDFGVKYTTKKQNLIQQKCAPEVAKIKKKFGSDQKRVQAQTQSLYKREGMNAGVSCIIMLINLVLTMVIFFTFYSSLGKNSTYQAINEYETLNTAFFDSYYKNLADYSQDDDITNENAKEITEKYKNVDNYFKDTSKTETDEHWAENNAFKEKYSPAIAHADKKATEDVVKTWNNIKSNWLWVDNIWVADATTSPFPTYESIKTGKYKEYVEKNVNESQYNVIAKIVNEQGGRKDNGYYILAVLAAIITFLSQYITELHTRLKNKKANTVAKKASDSSMGMSMKIMKFVMPIIMLIFVLTSSASFGIYILASNISSIAIGEIINLIVNKLTKKKQIEVEEYLEKEANRLIKKGKLQEK